MPDRLPSLILLAGFWIPPAVAGVLAARALTRRRSRERRFPASLALGVFVAVYAAAWFAFQLKRIPPYVPGATLDPTFAPPEAVRGLLIVAAAIVLPGSAMAAALAFAWRRRASGPSVAR